MSAHLPSLTEELLKLLHAHTLGELHTEHSSPVSVLIRDVFSGGLRVAATTEEVREKNEGGIPYICRIVGTAFIAKVTLLRTSRDWRVTRKIQALMH